MPDTVSEKRRSEIMSHIRSKDTSIELLVRRWLHSLGYRFRVNYKLLPGKPDIAFTKKKIVVFIHGCFWHGHQANCRYSHVPQSRVEYWNEKIERTKERDRKYQEILVADGWKVITIWECEIKTDFEMVIRKLQEVLDHQL